jgi:hypothetical protein
MTGLGSSRVLVVLVVQMMVSVMRKGIRMNDYWCF